jgi:lipopolysaccharide/colanic/teichoic acid biosynthesis glycosyltransferase
MKRAFDIIVALFGLIVLTPFFLVIGFLIKWNDNGPVFFQQVRVGKHGKSFVLYKLRSMRVPESSEEGSFEPANTSRITSIGKFLRRTKLDELPQLFNVVKGDMSLVGPRPEVEKWVAVYPERWKRILSVKPGITDNSSIEFRNEDSLLAQSEDPEKTYKEVILSKKLDLYEDYVVNNSFFGDLKLIFKTIFSVIFK